MMRQSYVTLLILALAALTGIAQPPTAQASSLYYELQGGMTKMRKTAPFFGDSAPESADMGTSFNFAIAHSFSGGEVPIEIQVGLQALFSNSSSGTDRYFSTLVPYPFVRLQLNMLYVGAGLSPALWKRSSTGPGIDGLEFTTGTMAYLAEAGALWAVTPQFSLGIAGSAQYLGQVSDFSPGPVLGAMGVMRFYFGFSKGSSGGRKQSSGEFRGWRYPFGNELQSY